MWQGGRKEKLEETRSIVCGIIVYLRSGTKQKGGAVSALSSPLPDFYLFPRFLKRALERDHPGSRKRTDQGVSYLALFRPPQRRRLALLRRQREMGWQLDHRMGCWRGTEWVGRDTLISRRTLSQPLLIVKILTRTCLVFVLPLPFLFLRSPRRVVRSL